MNVHVDLPQPTLSWARARLRLGQTNVGTWVVVAAAVLLTRSPAAAPAGPWLAEAVQWAGWVGLWVLLQLPFDVVGGYLLPVRHGRRKPGVAAWVSSWVRGVAVHSAVVIGVGWMVMAVASRGPLAAAALVTAALLTQVALQGMLLFLSADLRSRPIPVSQRLRLVEASLDPSHVRQMDTEERSFVGGWLGLPGFERLVLPTAWLRNPSVLPIVAARRAWVRDSGARARGVWGALMFQLAGWGAAVVLLPGVRLDTASGLLAVSAAVTLWGFLGLLTLPSASRRAVIAADQDAARVHGVSTVARTLRRLDRDQEDEDDDARSPTTGAIFHPVPTPSRRIAALEATTPTPLPAWRITRMALFLGWSTGSWLSRAVHCNIGRPELWVVLPGD